MIHLIGSTLVAHAIFVGVAIVGSLSQEISPEYKSCIERAESAAIARNNASVEDSTPLHRAARLNSLAMTDAQLKADYSDCLDKEFARREITE